MTAESSEDENEFQGDEDVPMEEDTPTKRRRSVVSYAEDDNDNEEEEESDDDVPLSSLAAPKKKAKKATPAKKKKTTPKKATPTPSTTSSSSEDYTSASAALYGTKCQKGLLVQRLLCRWWYAIEWPSKASLPKEAPENYDPLDGFPGVYVCTQGDEVGKIHDVRDPSTRPNFDNMARKTSTELQELLLKALQEQRQQLIDAEGSGTETQKELDKLLSWAKKVKTTSADKEALKVLKAAKQSLD